MLQHIVLRLLKVFLTFPNMSSIRVLSSNNLKYLLVLLNEGTLSCPGAHQEVLSLISLSQFSKTKCDLHSLVSGTPSLAAEHLQSLVFVSLSGSTNSLVSWYLKCDCWLVRPQVDNVASLLLSPKLTGLHCNGFSIGSRLFLLLWLAAKWVQFSVGILQNNVFERCLPSICIHFATLFHFF